jgi:limonene-1,2-epoxide hydrolase
MGNEDPSEVMSRLVATWDSGDIDGMLDLFAEDAVVHGTMSMDPVIGKPVVGRPAIRKLVTKLLGAMEGRLHAEIHHQIVCGNLVMNERTDHFTLNGRDMAVPVCGVLEIEDGRIKAWRDYTDHTPFNSR